ncbi:sugar MFS transporter [Sphingomonas sp. MMS24-J45]|uniref:sugar MFS transporter n=1 Tax=Sphingomonas sp. MMS24-J45 TaxID=3238806 RepID=UPI0038517B8C
MALTPGTTAQPSDSQGVNAPNLQVFVFALFFIFGGITSLNDVIIPKLKDLFTLNYFQALLVQSAFFAAYFIFSIPAAAIVRKAGYLRSASIGLLIMTAGCLLFIPASQSGQFVVFLFALFVLAAGITTVQVVANPLISLLGKPATAHSRLTFAQAFNSLGTTIFPIVGSILILGSLAKIDPKTLSGAALDAYRTAETQVVVNTYLVLAFALVIVAGVVWTRRNALPNVVEDSGSVLRAFNLLERPRFGFGAACIFLYVGAEVAIGSLIVNYLIQADVFGIAAAAAGTYVGFYWGGAMVGRFIGTVVLRLVSPGKVLAAVAAGSITLILITANTTGHVAGWSLLAIGLMNSIMFPTIFTLASEGLGKRAAEGSGIIAMAIVGGAVIPPLTGLIADASSLRFALLLPAVCYGLIAAYGWFARKPVAA